MHAPSSDNLRKQLAAFARRMARDAEEAEDLVQECLTALHHHRDAISDEQATLAWCQTVLRKLFRQRLRREWYGRIEAVGLEEAPEGRTDPWEQVDERMVVEAALAQLPDLRETVTRRFYLDGRAITDLAAELGRPPGTIKRWLHESREAMRMSLRETTK
jgi:RNA polymerase sigma factor (sigma-70 family)